MGCRTAWWTLIGLMLATAELMAQTPYRPPATRPQAQAPTMQQAPAGQPGQSRWPPYPTLERRTDASQQPQTPQPPFVLSAQEQALLDQVLALWEQRGEQVNTFASKFTRWHYDLVFSQDPLVDEGEVKYAAPDKGSFQVVGDQPEHWICDGKSIFQYEYGKKQLTEYKLPAQLQGKGITDSPLPFLFGSTASQLKNRYYLRVITPPTVADQVWLEARPRFQGDAQNFQKAEVILSADGMLPSAIQTHDINGKTRTVYKFEKPQVNANDPLRKLDPLNVFGRDPFKPSLPRGWTKVIEDVPTAQAGAPPAAVRR